MTEEEATAQMDGDEEYEEELYEFDETMDPEEIKKKLLEMDEEVNKLDKMQKQVEQQITSASDKIDETSIYVGQVDYEATPEELRTHFAPCGTINRITIMCDKMTGQAKGFAYLEFVDKESVDNALKLNDSVFKGRQIKVLPKRQNMPTIPVRGRGGRGRFGFRGRAPFGGRAFAGRGRGRSSGRFRGGRGRGHPSYYQSYY